MISEEELRRMYREEGMTQLEIAELCGVRYPAISKLMKMYDIKSRTNSESQLGNIVKPTKEVLEKMYWDNQMSMRGIAKEIGVSNSIVNIWMKKYGIESRTNSESQLGNIVKPSKEYLEEIYCDKKMTLLEISDEIGAHLGTVLNWLKSYDIKTRTNSDYFGENSSRWEGGISFEPYCDKFNNQFKESVRERDNYTCQLCGFEQNGQKLSVHHIHYDKSNCYPDVVSLCRSCHSKVNINKDYWEEYFENQLIERGLYCWSLSNIIA